MSHRLTQLWKEPEMPEDGVSQVSIPLTNTWDEQFIKRSGLFGSQIWVYLYGPVSWVPLMRTCTVMDDM